MAKFLLNYDEVDIDDCEGVMVSLIGAGIHSKSPTKFDIDLNNHDTQPAKPSIEAPLDLELKELPNHLKYAFLGMDNTLSGIVETELQKGQTKALIDVLKKYEKPSDGLYIYYSHYFRNLYPQNQVCRRLQTSYIGSS